MKLSQTQDYLLFIDEKAEIKEGTKWIYDKDSPSIIPLLGNTNIVKEGISKGWFNKIIAYRKLNKEAKELDLPELPPFEVDIEIMWSDFNKNHNRNCPLGKEQFVRAINYKAAQSKQFSLEDIKEALKQFAVEAGSIDGAIDVSSPASAIKWINHYIQSLSTQQLPKEFIPSVKEISKYSYRDNSGNEYFTFKGLTRGDIIISNKNQEGIGGDFIPYPMTLIKKDKEYIIKDVSSFGFYRVPWIINEDGDHTIPNFDTFSIKNNEKFKTITNSEGKRELVGTYKY